MARFIIALLTAILCLWAGSQLLAGDPAVVAAFGIVKELEGFKATAYRCQAGRRTVGYGDTRSKAGTVTKAAAEKRLAAQLEETAGIVDAAVKRALEPNQKAALISFAFNVGRTAFAKSELVRKINAGKLSAVPGEMRGWNKITKRKGGKKIRMVSPGLKSRREAEVALWLGKEGKVHAGR